MSALDRAVALPPTQEEINRRAGKLLPPVQGIASTNVDDLTLRDGRSLRVALGEAMRDDGATMTRTMAGGSSITLTVHDPKMRLQNDSLLKATFDARIDGVWFRYIGAKKSGKALTLSLIERPVALLKDLYGPVKKVPRRTEAGGTGVTRAEFILALVQQARPQIPAYIPELHKIQPVGKPEPETSDADAVRTPGFSGGVTVKGAKPNPEQVKVATDAMTVADQYDAPQLARVAMFCALTQENNMTASTNDGPFAFLDSTAASLGVDKHDTKACAKLFLVDGIWDPPGEPKLGAIGWANHKPDADPGWIAQQIEGSAYPGLYSQWADEGRKWVAAWGGSSGTDASSINTTSTEPYAFEVGENENFWDAIKRLAGQVNYRAFVTGGRFFYVAEPILFSQQVRLGIAQENGEILTRGVDEVDYDFNQYKPITEATVTARAKDWACPPGTVVTLRGFGPASVGDYFSNPRLRTVGKTDDGKPMKAALDRARPVVGRYLVSSIDSSFFTDTVSVKLRKPTEPLPEPAAETSTATSLSDDGTEATGNDVFNKMVAEVERIIGLGFGYAWGGGHGSPPSADGKYDCSGFVSRILYVGGFLQAGLATSGLISWGQPGEGDLCTVYVRETGDPHQSHTIMKLGDRFCECGGGQDRPPGDGPTWFTPSPSYLASFTTKRHPPGL